MTRLYALSLVSLCVALICTGCEVTSRIDRSMSSMLGLDGGDSASDVGSGGTGGQLDFSTGFDAAMLTDSGDTMDGSDFGTDGSADGGSIRIDAATPACDDGIINGRETGLDCGGECGACPDGQGCQLNMDCLSGRCLDGECRPVTCGDGVLDPEEDCDDGNRMTERCPPGVEQCRVCGADCTEVVGLPDDEPCDGLCNEPAEMCLEGACTRIFWVSEVNGSNATGDGTQARPWRTIAFALERGRIEPSGDNEPSAARLYVLPGRYAPDQWLRLPQCEGADDADVQCAEHRRPCETDGNPNTRDVCTECICDPQLSCAGNECSLPESELESLPVRMKDTIQVVGHGDKAEVVIDGSTLECFTGFENRPRRCDLERTQDDQFGRGRLIYANDMMDQAGQDDPRSRQMQPYWYGHGARNLIANLTLIRGGYRDNPAIEVSSSLPYIVDGMMTALRMRAIDFELGYSDENVPLLKFERVDALLARFTFRHVNAGNTDAPISAIGSNVIFDRSEFKDNLLDDERSLIEVLGGWVDVQSSVFVGNTGGGITYEDSAGGTVTYSTFANNAAYAVKNVSGEFKPIIISNNIFANTDQTASLLINNASTGKTVLYNNLFYEGVRGALIDGIRNDVRTLVDLNRLSFAALNRIERPGFVSLEDNNLRLNVDSPAIDIGTPQPLPNPVSTTQCLNNDECRAAGAEAYWSQPAETCFPRLGVCAVDVNVDSDGDDAPDWLERIAAPLSIPPEAANEVNSERRTINFQPSVDFDGIPRPQGRGRDVGAFEYAPQR